MRLSNLADYAVVLMSAAARQCGSVAIHAGMLAEQTGIPGPTAQKLVSGLARAGLLVASRGSGGGVRLARPAAAISIADIIEAVEGPIALTACCDEGRHDCSLEGNCQVQPHLGVVNGAVRNALGGISLASLTVQPTKQGPFVSSEVETPIGRAPTMGVSTSGNSRKFILSDAAGGVEGLDTNGIRT